MHNRIRRMTLEDAAAVHAIEMQVATGPWSERLFYDCVSVGYECWVMVDNNIIIGYGILSYGANEAHVLNLAIEPAFQQRGLGKKLLEHLIDVAKSLGAYEIFLEVRLSNDVARSLYEKLNFAEIGLRKGYYPAEGDLPAEDAVTLALPLR